MFIVNDHRLFVEALERMLDSHSWIEAVGSAEADSNLTRQVAAAKPDVIIADLGRRKIRVTTLIQELRDAAPQARIILQSLFPDEGEDQAALQAGVDEFMAKEDTVEHLMDAIRRASGRA